MEKRRDLKAKFWIIQCLLEEPTKKRKSQKKKLGNSQVYVGPEAKWEDLAEERGLHQADVNCS